MTKVARPRVLMVINHFYPEVGGAEIQAMRLSQTLLSKGAKVNVFTVHQRGLESSEYLDDLRIIRVGKYTFGSIKVIYSTLRLILYLLLNRKKYDIIHVHGVTNLAFAAAVTSRLTGLPSIVKLVNSGDRFDFKMVKRKYKLGGFISNYVKKNISLFMAITPVVANDLKETGVEEERIRIIPNGIPFEELKPRAKKDAKLRLIATSRLVPQKNIEFALMVVAKLNIPFVLNVFGDGQDHMKLKELSNDFNLQDKVFFHGSVDSDIIRKELKSADIFILPSKVEGLSNALLEAMAFGKYCIVSDIAPNLFVLGELSDQYALPLKSELWTSRISSLFSEYHRIEEAGSKFNERAKYFEMSTIAEKYIELYDSIIAA